MMHIFLVKLPIVSLFKRFSDEKSIVSQFLPNISPACFCPGARAWLAAPGRRRGGAGAGGAAPWAWSDN